ncbi:MAG TPA: glycosyltransferase family 2 protein [Candidatus Nanoarchaeia archaeon]|nr:glycosyltransferase family 2 protein [Candidatus Nanoarchaeia archaeon]
MKRKKKTLVTGAEWLGRNAPKHKISLVMPCYNEGSSIYKNIKETINTMGDFNNFNIDYEIILVDDGSTDNTYSEIKKIKSKKVKLVSYKPNKGKGHALVYGFKFVTGDLVAFIDSDLEIHPKQLLRFISYVYEYNADIVIGSKRHPDAKVNYPLKRKILSTGYHLFVNLLFGLQVHDTQSGLKLLRYSAAKKILPMLVVKHYAFDLELLVVAKKFNLMVKEAPIEVNFNFDRKRIGVTSSWPILNDTLGIAYRKYILRYYDPKKRA